jgi:LysM repeat protein
VKQKDLLESLNADDDQEDLEAGQGYSSWNKGRRQEFDADASRRSLKPYLFLGAGLVVLLAFLVLFIPLSRTTGSSNQVKSLEGRLKNIEERVFALEGVEKRLAQVEQRTAGIEGAEKKVAQLEQRVAELTRLTEKPAAPSPTPTKAQKASTTSQPSPEARYHKVRAGDTVYGIARRYGLTVDELTRLNKLGPGAVLHPGDKLVVSKGKSSE